MSYCKDCHGINFKEVLGDLLCTNCGLVQQSFVLDPGPEWRSFAEEWAPKKDKCRTGCSASDLSTVISANNSNKLVICHRMINPAPNPLQVVQDDIMSKLQHKLNLSDDTIALANEILKEYVLRSKKSYKGDRRRLYFVAAAINYASRALPSGARTRHEICDAAEVHNTSVFSKICTEIMIALEGTDLEKRLMRVSVGTLDIINRNISKLIFIQPKDVSAVRRSVLKIHDRVVGDDRILHMKTEKVTAGMIYMACMMNRIPHTTHENVSMTTNSSVSTIRDVETIIKKILLTTSG